MLMTAIVRCHSQTAPAPLPLESGLLIVCGKTLQIRECRQAQAAVAQALDSFKPALHNWRFVVVPDHDWNRVSKDFHRTRWTPAFSNLRVRTTYLNSRLAVIFEGSRHDEELARFTLLTGINRLEWVLGHELGHVLCETLDHEIAENAGNKLRLSKSRQVNCGNAAPAGGAGADDGARPATPIGPP